MKYNSKIGLGTVQFGLNYGISNRIGQTTINDVKEIFMFAKQNRIDLFDTANSYGDSEYVLGQIGIENFNVVTKFNAITTFECLDQFNTSLYNLKVNSVYGLLSHNVSHLIEDRCVWDVMEELKKKKNF